MQSLDRGCHSYSIIIKGDVTQRFNYVIKRSSNNSDRKSRGKAIDIAIPGYRIIRSIGKGGMATVYLAVQESFQREVALKIMSATLSEDSNFSERFLQEARIVSRLIHPNIVTVHDVGIHEGHHYLSMAYIPGHELKEKLNSLTGAEILRVLSDVARALDYSGKKGYVHRDVKPENILLHEEDGHAVLMDFGIARAADVASSMTMTGMALGTPHYMSPEQARGKAVDPRSDLYSLGALMYLMIIGAVPYEAETAVAIGIKHISEPIPTLPAPLASFQPVLSKLMAKKPEDRYQTGAELIKALQGLAPAELDRWREQRASKPVGRHDTPVRGVKKQARSQPSKLAAARPESKTGGGSAAGDALHIPKEDIFDRKDRQQKPFGAGLLLVVLLVVLAAAAIAYKGIATPGGFDSWLVAVGLKKAQPQQVVAPTRLEVTEPDSIPSTEAESTSAVAQEADSPLQLLLEESRQLAQTIETDPQRAPELVALYQKILLEQADQLDALAGLAALKQQSLQWVRDYLNSGELDMADQAMIDALLHFPDLVDSADYQSLQAQVVLQRQHNEQLLLAQQYFQQDKLMAPAGENAREIYEAILLESPGNSSAQAGLEKIAARYHQLAMASRQKGEFARAMTLVTRGLSINDDDLALSALKDELKEQINLQQYTSELLAEAEKFKSQGIWFAAQNSAAQRYLQVLSLQSGQSQARDGLQQMVDEVLRQVELQLELHNLDGASGLLAPALDLMPENQALLAMSERLAASQPRVSELEFSSTQDYTELQDLARVKAGRTLYIRLRYSNFKPSTTVLKAILFDGSRSVQIAAVPVIVNGTQGSGTFRIDRSVEGFKEGGYHMDIMLEDKRIATQEFVVAPYE